MPNPLGHATLERAPARPPAPRGPLRALLRIPLLAKLAGANVVLALAGGTIAVVAMRQGVSTREVLVLFAIGSAIALLVNLALVHVALRPLVELERTADRVWRGDFGARVPPNALADRDIRRTADTMNRLLDGLTGDRERMRTLASQAIRAGDEERARIARELHDSTAQTIAAVKLELTALQNARQADAALHDRLGAIIDLAGMALEEVRTLAHTVHPRVLDDLGLPSALQWLSRRIHDHEGLEIDVELPPRGEEPALSADEAAVLASHGIEPGVLLVACGLEGMGGRLRPQGFRTECHGGSRGTTSEDHGPTGQPLARHLRLLCVATGRQYH